MGAADRFRAAGLKGARVSMSFGSGSAAGNRRDMRAGPIRYT